MGYELRDTDTGNLWCGFGMEAEAPAEVRRIVAEFGLEAAESLSLVRAGYRGRRPSRALPWWCMPRKLCTPDRGSL